MMTLHCCPIDTPERSQSVALLLSNQMVINTCQFLFIAQILKLQIAQQGSLYYFIILFEV